MIPIGNRQIAIGNAYKQQPTITQTKYSELKAKN